MSRLEDLIDFARNEPQSHQDMVEQILLMTEEELDILDSTLITVSAARTEAGLLIKKRRVH